MICHPLLILGQIVVLSNSEPNFLSLQAMGQFGGVLSALIHEIDMGDPVFGSAHVSLEFRTWY